MSCSDGAKRQNDCSMTQCMVRVSTCDPYNLMPVDTDQRTINEMRTL